MTLWERCLVSCRGCLQVPQILVLLSACSKAEGFLLFNEVSFLLAVEPVPTANEPGQKDAIPSPLVLNKLHFQNGYAASQRGSPNCFPDPILPTAQSYENTQISIVDENHQLEELGVAPQGL
ncbi:uncharacterized protein EV154DRAFT_485973 [Mucor mucedo]|uniref:uncharacterized protein n=1 Tax=Mucor mucedo TaxID=29922 RepID=UPI0022208DD7|nr:uncharacterized protein EV154DRAFT_485973 [Mucor mucedo]KAI7880017.1 hypothetical protein EV154DRAFT_485973 [Mucor mucedo]